MSGSVGPAALWRRQGTGRARSRPLLAIVGLLAMLLPIALGALPVARASGVNYPSFQVTISGPAVLPSNGSGIYKAVASGGPAETLSGVYVGNYTFTDQIIGVDTTGSFVTPTSGAFSGQLANFSLGGLTAVGTYTFELNVTSHGAGSRPTNLTQVFDYQFQVVLPYLIKATLQNLNSYTVSGAVVDILLDGNPVGSTSVSSMAASGTTQITYNYSTTTPLSAGYHTFTFVLVGAYGLLEFSNGENSYSVTFYVSGPAPDYTTYWVLGIGFTAVAVLISLMFFGQRRRSKKKKTP